jgi:hypothetical protein
MIKLYHPLPHFPAIEFKNDIVSGEFKIRNSEFHLYEQNSELSDNNSELILFISSSWSEGPY